MLNANISFSIPCRERETENLCSPSLFEMILNMFLKMIKKEITSRKEFFHRILRTKRVIPLYICIIFRDFQTLHNKQTVEMIIIIHVPFVRTSYSQAHLPVDPMQGKRTHSKDSFISCTPQPHVCSDFFFFLNSGFHQKATKFRLVYENSLCIYSLQLSWRWQ